jgi:hypothetical protein
MKKTIKAKLEKFALKHKLILEEHGEVGFGRPCVGFLTGDSYLDYPPVYSHGDAFKEIYPDCDFPTVDNSYHKHNCLAVLVRGDDYAKGLDELAEWVDKIEAKGEVEVVDYATGASGIQATLSGLRGKCLIYKP